jgi:hypothetical protein
MWAAAEAAADAADNPFLTDAEKAQAAADVSDMQDLDEDLDDDMKNIIKNMNQKKGVVPGKAKTKVRTV